MCGIAGIYLRNPDVQRHPGQMDKMMDVLLAEIEYRGKQATGYVAITTDGKVQVDKSATKATDFVKERDPLPENTRILLLHTRFKTKGNVEQNKNNHPVIYGSCFVTHNGTIYNDDKLFEAYKLKRHAEVDTEIIPALLSTTDYSLDSVRNKLELLRGPAAIAAVDPVNNPNKVILARTEHSPLVYVDKGSYVVWASTEKAIQEAWGATIGTPPEWRHIKRLSLYTVLELHEDGVESCPLARPAIVTKPRFRSGTQVYRQGKWYDAETGKEVPKEPGWTRPTYSQSLWNPAEVIAPGEEYYSIPWIDMQSIRTESTKLRQSGNSRNILFAHKYRLIRDKQAGPWVHCEMCSMLVHQDSIIASTRGKICLDCKEAWLALAKAAHEEHNRTDTESGRIVNKLLAAVAEESNEPLDIKERFVGLENLWAANSEALSTFNAWASDEEFFHTETLAMMAKHTPFEADALDYLMFRVHPDYTEAYPAMEAYIKELTRIYDELRADLCEAYEEDDEDEITVLAELGDSTQAQPPPKKVVIPFVRASGRDLPTRKPRCIFCKDKAKLALSCAEIGSHTLYCSRHWEQCSTVGCDRPANHTRKDGLRVCHEHARGVKECYADSVLQSVGYTIGGAK